MLTHLLQLGDPPVTGLCGLRHAVVGWVIALLWARGEHEQESEAEKVGIGQPLQKWRERPRSTCGPPPLLWTDTGSTASLFGSPASLDAGAVLVATARKHAGGMATEGALHEVRSGRRLHVFHHEVAGARKRILLIHGSLANWRQYESQIACFLQEQPDVSLVAADAFGCGRSPKPDEW